jgi:hypothetical protein
MPHLELQPRAILLSKTSVESLPRNEQALLFFLRAEHDTKVSSQPLIAIKQLTAGVTGHEVGGNLLTQVIRIFSERFSDEEIFSETTRKLSYL